MKRKTLSKKQIRKATALELIFRMHCLHAESERRPENAGVPVADIREAKAIDDELRLRLYKILAGFKESRK